MTRALPCHTCGGVRAPSRSRCASCLSREADNARSNYTPYVPIDEWMTRETSKVLLALRHFDWVSTADLADAVGAPLRSQDSARLNSHQAALYSLVQSGQVERLRFGRYHMVRLAPSVDRKNIVPMDWSVIA